MEARSSTATVVRVTSAQKYAGLSSFTETHSPGVPRPRKSFRASDPDPKVVMELTPDDVGKRIVIRSGDFLGSIYGTLLGVNAHKSLVHFTSIQLYGKKELTFRDDTEVLVLDF